MSYQNKSRNLSALKLSALACGCALALAYGSASALQSDADQQVFIESDRAEIDQNNETIVYTGSVTVVQGTLAVSGEMMIVKINGDQVERITTLGSPAQYSQELENDQGVVRAHADSIIYDMSTERIYLKGKAVIEQLGSTLKSESIRYDMVQGKIDAGAGETSGRVVMQLDQTRVRKTDDTDD